MFELPATSFPGSGGGFVRIPIWGHVALSIGARRILEWPGFVRLQEVRQLPFVQFVFPGASHSRFEHSIGTHHLANLMVGSLASHAATMDWGYAPATLEPEEARCFSAAALLHDAGHIPFAHMLEQLQQPNGCHWFAPHEARSREIILNDTRLGDLLRVDWGLDPAAVAAAISPEPCEDGLPARLLSGVLDPDKMDYLMRDAAGCAVPYGHVDADRLIECVLLDSQDGRRRLAITEKGVAPLESLIFAKYMMYHHVYWHHTARIATAMFLRASALCLEAGRLQPADFTHGSDDRVMERLAAASRGLPPADALMAGLRERRLFKRALSLHTDLRPDEPEFSLSPLEIAGIAALSPARLRELEAEIAYAAGGPAAVGGVLIDLPATESVFDLDDLDDLRVLACSQHDRRVVRFVPFVEGGFSSFTGEVVSGFESASRKVLVVCRPDLRAALTAARHETAAAIRAALRDAAD